MTKSHVVALDSEEFQKELQKFAAACRVVKGLKNLTILAVGARTTAFKTMRFDEITAQKYGINVETIDLSDFFLRMKDVDPESPIFKEKLKSYLAYADFSKVPKAALENIVRAGIAADELAQEYGTDCMTIRCWDEFQREMQISVCSMIGELNDRGIVTACELDLSNAICMKALACASQEPAMCLDFNNNYGTDPNKCILFHCGPICNTYMDGKGEIIEHKMFKKTMGDDVAWGVDQGHIRAMPFTFASAKTDDGRIQAYVGKGQFTDDPIEDGFFGTGGVAEIRGLQKKMRIIAREGFRHHVSVTEGHYRGGVLEAFRNYIGFDIVKL